MNRLAVVLGIFALIAPMTVPLEAANRKGDKFIKQGREAEARREYDKALELYEQALDTDPMDIAYKLAVNRIRFQASQTHLQRGRALRGDGKLDAALQAFQKAFAIDPSSTVAEQELRRTIQIIDRVKKEAEGGAPAEDEKPEDYNLSPGQAARQAAEEKAAAIRGVPDLKPLSPQITNLKIVNQSPKVVFETIGKLAGVNMLFDTDYTKGSNASDRFSIDLARTSLSDALDHAALITKSFWKPLTENTIFITQDTRQKRTDYEEHVTKVFYLQNITTPQELSEIMTAMRQVTDMRKVFPLNSQSAIVVRGTADQMALADKIILDLDKPKPEVVVDILVFEVSRDKIRDLGISFGDTGLTIPVTFTPNGTGEGSNSTIPLSQIGRVSSNDWSVQLPSATLRAMLDDSRTRVLQSPTVRATDGQKASLKLGDRYPYATGSFQTGATAGINPLVSTQFQFADVGVNVDLTPRIHSSDEVSLQVELEVSAIARTIDVGGLSQPVIGQRRVTHIIRVKEGQMTMVGGLMGVNESRGTRGLPWLSTIPGIGKLFGLEHTEVHDKDLLVLLVPHVVRFPEITPGNLRAVASGSDTIYKVSYAPSKAQSAPKTGPVGPAAGTVPAQGTGTTQPSQALPQTSAPGIQTIPPQVLQPAPQTEPQQTPPPDPAAGAAPPPTSEQAKPAPTGPTPVVQLIPSAPSVAVNGNVTVRVNVENVTDLFAAPMRITYDNKVLKLLDIRRGPFMGGDGAQVTFDQSKVESPGMAVIGMNRVAGAGGVSGSGTLVTLVFQAVGAGSTEVKFDELTLRDTKLQSITVARPVARVTVK